MDQDCSSASGAPGGPVVQVCFPSVRAAVLDSLNRQREEGRLCDLSIQVQGQVFRAHRCVLAASSPYFHDQVCPSVCVSLCVHRLASCPLSLSLSLSLCLSARFSCCSLLEVAHLLPLVP
ncbi:hypothetical protein AAFF_G00289020 [Aldrovandia affinis]|uniref:BTB domain-containing protein n=1 Tax=Aldrovandia affinis TaxID=143900 RepID=A0AAD7R9Z9_9TELE|nr:hypothetical protein AAFF_G00289020 [Aldrovandia affinis]